MDLNKKTEQSKNVINSPVAITMFKDYPDLLTVDDIQEILNIGRTLAYKLLKDNTIKSNKIGRSYKVAKIHLIQYVLGNDYHLSARQSYNVTNFEEDNI